MKENGTIWKAGICRSVVHWIAPNETPPVPREGVIFRLCSRRALAFPQSLFPTRASRRNRQYAEGEREEDVSDGLQGSVPVNKINSCRIYIYTRTYICTRIYVWLAAKCRGKSVSRSASLLRAAIDDNDDDLASWLKDALSPRRDIFIRNWFFRRRCIAMVHETGKRKRKTGVESKARVSRRRDYNPREKESLWKLQFLDLWKHFTRARILCQNWARVLDIPHFAFRLFHFSISANACSRHPFESDIAKIYMRGTIALFLTFSKDASWSFASSYLDVYA